jgi:hypothetical protein
MCVCVPHLYPIYNNRGFVINFANLSLCHINHFFFFFQSLPSLHQVNHLFPISPLVLFLLDFLLPHLTVTLTSLNHSPSFLAIFLPPYSFYLTLLLLFFPLFFQPFPSFFGSSSPPLFHTLPLQFLQPFLSPYYSSSPIFFSINFFTTFSTPLFHSNHVLPTKQGNYSSSFF